MAGLEGSPSRSLLLDIQQIPADLRLAQLIRRPSVMLGQAAHRLLINLLCLVGQSTQLHVLDHTGAQRCHRLLLRRRHTGGTTPPRHRRIASPASLRPCRHSLGRSRSVQRWTYWRTSSHEFRALKMSTISPSPLVSAASSPGPRVISHAFIGRFFFGRFFERSADRFFCDEGLVLNALALAVSGTSLS